MGRSSYENTVDHSCMGMIEANYVPGNSHHCQSISCHNARLSRGMLNNG